MACYRGLEDNQKLSGELNPAPQQAIQETNEMEWYFIDETDTANGAPPTAGIVR